MGASATGLAGVGIPPQAAKFLGYIIGSASGNGTAQVGATAVLDNYTIATASGGNTAFVLPNLNVGHTRDMVNTSGTTALVFPPVGGQINGLGANNSVNVPANKAATFVCISVASGVSSYAVNVGS